METCCAGVWAKFHGLNVEGRSVAVSGVVVAGPDEATVNGRPMLAITVHDHRSKRDHVLACDIDATADLINEVTDYKLPDPFGRQAASRHRTFRPKEVS